MKTLLLTIALCAGLAIAGCGGDSGPSGDSSESTTAETTVATKESSDQKTKPEVTVPNGAPPKTLEVNDLEVGSGAKAKDDDKLTVQYVGVLYKDGKEFDSSWSRNEPLAFTLSVGEAIPGWIYGVKGMKVGGRRELIIPPRLAYGEAGYPSPYIPPNETLVYVIDLLEVN